ncbi:MAG TPA: hypothetical protein VJQ58_01245 [Burkholderiales bacterium]|nr:hypothetical protein [Burkholderiales bacterium]
MVLIAVSAWLAHLHVVSQSYHPVVRLATPDGLTYTAVQDAKHERQECGAANERFLGPVKQTCKDCQVEIARCERHLEGFELDIYERKRIREYVVQGPGVRMAIAGPAKKAQASCEQIARQMVRNGLRQASCVQPVAG